MKNKIARMIVNALGIRRVMAWAGVEPKVELTMRVRRYDVETQTHGEWESPMKVGSTVVTEAER